MMTSPFQRRRSLSPLLPMVFVALGFHFWVGNYSNLRLAAGFYGRCGSLLGNTHNQGRLSQTRVPSDSFDHAISGVPFDNQSRLRQTTIPKNVSTNGFTIFDNLYLRNGTLFIVTDKRDSFPQLPHILSKPERMEPGAFLSPTEKEIQIIHPGDAQFILGGPVFHLDGFTVLLYDPDQFTNHYYHWWGEIVLGIWRVYSKLRIREDGTLAPLPAPTRFIAPFIGDSGWRDGPSLNGPLMRAAFPSTPIEKGDYWRDLIQMENTVVFGRVMVVNRVAAHTHPFSRLWFKMIAGTLNLNVPEGFWDPIRHSVLNNILGYIPVSPKPVVTYITRRRRTLNDANQHALLAGLKKLEREGICEVYVVQMEKMTMKEQLALAARTTILLGVHGNGLTHQLWMTPSAKSTVIEIFIPQGYTFDYEILARNLGHRHYAVWNDTALTYPKGKTHPGSNFPEGFHGNEIPLHAQTVTRIIRERLAGSK
ncbi:hypothetical protein L218DRAFT_217394 [Marasmius fiardii PR-910]|nr:hypothetical protein L218DRAFT_217394 [Marasmius fiardii PR-910]